MLKLKNFFLLILTITSLALFLPDNEARLEVENIRVTIRTGDTVWHLAERFKGEQEDVRLVVARICEANRLNGKVIFPGDELVIPVAKKFSPEMLARASE